MPPPSLFFRSIRRARPPYMRNSGVEEERATWKMAVTANPIGFREN